MKVVAQIINMYYKKKTFKIISLIYAYPGILYALQLFNALNPFLHCFIHDIFSNFTIFNPLLMRFPSALIGLIHTFVRHLKPALRSVSWFSSLSSGQSSRLQARCLLLGYQSRSLFKWIFTALVPIFGEVNLHVQFISLHCHVWEFMEESFL